MSYVWYYIVQHVQALLITRNDYSHTHIRYIDSLQYMHRLHTRYAAHELQIVPTWQTFRGLDTSHIWHESQTLHALRTLDLATYTAHVPHIQHTLPTKLAICLWVKTPSPIHHIQYITLHYIALHHMTWHDITYVHTYIPTYKCAYIASSTTTCLHGYINTDTLDIHPLRAHNTANA